MSFEQLKQAIPEGQAYQQLTSSQVDFNSEWDDETALGVVLQDINYAMSYMQSKNVVTRYETADDLLRGYVRVRPWPNSDKARSALSVPLCLEVIEKLLPQLWLSIWGSGKDPFQVKPVGHTKSEVAMAWQHLLRWAVKVSKFKEGTRLTLKSALVYGNGIGFDGWEIDEIEQRKYIRLEDGTVKRDRKLPAKSIQRPTYESANLRNVIFDPNCATPDPSIGRFVAKRILISSYDLNAMREDSTYKNIPTEEELKALLPQRDETTKDSMTALKPNLTREMQAQQDTWISTADPLGQNLEIIEYRTVNRIVTVLQRKIVIRNEPNDSRSLSVHGCAFIDVLNSLHGFGIPQLLNGEQRFQQGVLNTSVDSLALSLNPSFQQVKGMGNTGQNIIIAPGKVTTVETELKPLIVPNVQDIAQVAIEASAQRAYRRVGAEGATSAPTQALRTGAGVSAFQGDITSRLQYFMEQFIDFVFIPVLQSFLTHCTENLQPEQINQILSDEDGRAYQGDILDMYNADVKIDVVAGIKLTARQASAQIAPLILQALQSDAIQQSLQLQGKKFDYVTFAQDWFELLGIDAANYFIPMTSADAQRVQQQNQAMQQGMAKAQQIQQQHAADLDSIDAKAAAQGQLAVLRSVVKQTEGQGLTQGTQGGGQGGV